MTVTYSGLKPRTTIYMVSATQSNGQPFPHGGAFGRLLKGNGPRMWARGKTMGTSGDERELPEWIEFKWQQSPYGKEHTLEQINAMPIHSQRVMVRARVPQDVVEEVIESHRRLKNNSLPDRRLHVYFVWTDEGIKLVWELEKVTDLDANSPNPIHTNWDTRILRSGGDKIVDPYQYLPR